LAAGDRNQAVERHEARTVVRQSPITWHAAAQRRVRQSDDSAAGPSQDDADQIGLPPYMWRKSGSCGLARAPLDWRRTLVPGQIPLGRQPRVMRVKPISHRGAAGGRRSQSRSSSRSRARSTEEGVPVLQALPSATASRCRSWLPRTVTASSRLFTSRTSSEHGPRLTRSHEPQTTGPGPADLIE
jgi:hypothetical protein